MIDIIEYVDVKTKWYLTIGKRAPWNNIPIRVPKLVSKIFVKVRKK